MADDLAAASAAKTDAGKETAITAKTAAAAGCPFHKAAAAEERASTAKTTAAAGRPFHKAAAAEEPAKISGMKEKQPTATVSGVFNYDSFYATELEKKHKDQSYRYFNNINRLADKFPVAHTADVNEEVQVWCANDYLGMGNNPVVLETMQCVLFAGTILIRSLR